MRALSVRDVHGAAAMDVCPDLHGHVHFGHALALTRAGRGRHAPLVNRIACWTVASSLVGGTFMACSSGSSGGSGPGGDGGTDAAHDGTMVDGARNDGSQVEGGGLDAAEDAELEPDAQDAAPVESGPPPTVLASDVPNPSYLVTDGTYLYWTDFVQTDAAAALGRVMKMPVAGGAEVTLATEPGLFPAGLAVDTANVYWVDSQGTLYAAPLAGGAAVTLATGVGQSSIAADGQFVYVESALGAGVARVPVDGGTMTTLALPDAGLAPAGIAIDTANVYWPAPLGGAILAVPKAGGATITLVSNGIAGAGAYVSATSYQNVVSDGTAVFWNRYPGSSSPSGGVLAVSVAGEGGAPSLLYDAGSNATPFSVVTDGANVYFLTAGNTPSLVRAPADGSAAVLLATDQFAAGITGDPGPTVAVDGVSVYWLSPPQILKVAK
jgi:hypothetical protein